MAASNNRREKKSHMNTRSNGRQCQSFIFFNFAFPYARRAVR